MTAPESPTSADATKQDRPKRPMRDLFEGLGIALLMAVFFKYFAIEAYQIPTSSMQPTMMGSASASVYDRLIVDKFRYSMFDPERWDIAVFKYPIRENQNYVKRIVGLPGDKIRIAGGNLYLLLDGKDGSDPSHFQILRKPARLQPHIWKEVFPARMEVLGGKTLLRNFFSGRGGDWSESDGVLTFKPRGSSSRATLLYSTPGADGLMNQPWDGYPTSVAREIKRKEGDTPQPRQVRDARMAFDLKPTSAPSKLTIEIEAEIEDDVYRYAFVWENGKGRLDLLIDGKSATAGDSIDLDLGGGAARRFRLGLVDDLLTLEVDGSEVATLDCDAHKSFGVASLVTPRVRITGGGELRFEDLVVERDLHYVASSRIGGNSVFPENSADKIIEVPTGYYMMFGDNTLGSVDSRDWTQLTVGVKDGKIVNPKKHPDAAIMRGNLRPTELSEAPDPDENPVPIFSQGKVVFTDHAGEVHTLVGKVNLDGGTTGAAWGRAGAWFQDEDGEAWHPETGLVQFVKRDHIIGRPLLNFWPLWSPFRFGLLR